MPRLGLLFAASRLLYFRFNIGMSKKKGKLDFCRIRARIKPCKKGESPIVEYKLVVLVASVPFMVFIVKRANSFNLKKWQALLITILLCTDVLLLPWIVQKGWEAGWIVFTILLVLLGSFWSVIQGKNHATTCNSSCRYPYSFCFGA